MVLKLTAEAQRDFYPWAFVLKRFLEKPMRRKGKNTLNDWRPIWSSIHTVSCKSS